LNQEFRNDILDFYKQFSVGAERAEHIKLKFKPERIYICGMGGSSLFTEIINNLSLYHYQENVFIRPLRGYRVPEKVERDDLFFVVSHSGNTEESLEALRLLKLKGARIVIIANGGQLLKIAEDEDIPHIIIPGGTQPRLATGYFIGAIGQVFEDAGLWPKGAVKDLVDSTLKLNQLLDENLAKQLANKITSASECKVPIVYGQEETEGVARAAKIKFNENCKIQSFYNFFPELNHNEMLGFSKMIMNPILHFSELWA
jgi:glucose/mannose-6-phosphate isomerase